MKVRPGNPLVSPPPTYSSTWIGDGEGGSVAGTVVVVVLCPLVCGGVPAAPALQVEKNMTKQMKISLILVADLGTNKKFLKKKSNLFCHTYTHTHIHTNTQVHSGSYTGLWLGLVRVGNAMKNSRRKEGEAYTHMRTVWRDAETTTKVTTGRKMKKKEGKRRHRQ